MLLAAAIGSLTGTVAGSLTGKSSRYSNWWSNRQSNRSNVRASLQHTVDNLEIYRQILLTKSICPRKIGGPDPGERGVHSAVCSRRLCTAQSAPSVNVVTSLASLQTEIQTASLLIFLWREPNFRNFLFERVMCDHIKRVIGLGY